MAFETLADAVQRPQVSSIARNTLIVALAFVASRILGFAREVLIARQFGTGGEADAYTAAFRLPDLLFLVVMSASFGSAFIPVFAGYLTRGDDRRAWDLASAVLTWAIGLTVVTGALIFILADPIIRYLIAPNLAEEYIDQSAGLMRVLVLSPLLLGLGIAAKGILEAQDRFLMPALAPLVYNVGIIVGIVLLAPTAGIEGVAVGVIIGAAGHALIQLPSVLRSGLRFRPTFSRSVDGLSEVGRLLVPRVIGQIAFAANFIVITNFASGLGEGGPASINYAWQLLMLPHGILALSISTVIFPAMARQWELADIGGLNRTVSEAIRPLIFLSIPISIVLFLYREPIVAALLQRGEFTRASTVAVAAPLAALAAALVAYGLVEVLTRAFYAMKDARTPVIAGLVIIVINVAVAALTIDRLDGFALGLALGVSTSVEAVILLVVLGIRLRALGVSGDGTWLPWLARVAVATVVSLAFGLLAATGLDRVWAVDGSTFVVRCALLLVAIALVVLPYALLAWALAVPELAMIDRRLARVARPLVRRVPEGLRRDLGVSRGLPLDRIPPSASQPVMGTDDASPDDGEWESAAASGPGSGQEWRRPRDQRREYERPAADRPDRPATGRDWSQPEAPESRTDERRRRPRPALPARSPEYGYGPGPPDDRAPWRPPPGGPGARPDDQHDGQPGTGRFGGGRRPPIGPRPKETDPRRTQQPESRPPFRSAQQPTMPSWYTPTRRGRRENQPPDASDYTGGSDGRSTRPRPDR